MYTRRKSQIYEQSRASGLVDLNPTVRGLAEALLKSFPPAVDASSGMLAEDIDDRLHVKQRGRGRHGGPVRSAQKSDLRGLEVRSTLVDLTVKFCTRSTLVDLNLTHPTRKQPQSLKQVTDSSL